MSEYSDGHGQAAERRHGMAADSARWVFWLRVALLALTAPVIGGGIVIDSYSDELSADTERALWIALGGATFVTGLAISLATHANVTDQKIHSAQAKSHEEEQADAIRRGW